MVSLPFDDGLGDPTMLARLTAIVHEAGVIGLSYFRLGLDTQARVDWKGDGSPVTEADHAVNDFLDVQLRALWPGAAWLSEESVDDPARLTAARVIIVDPIDGTRGFARGDANWCIAVALVERGRPIMAVVHAPANAETYTAVSGQGARLNGNVIAVHDDVGLTRATRLTCPGSLASALRSGGFDLAFQPKIASLALRIARVATGEYHACVASRDSQDWDLAAADLVLQEAGGLLADIDGQALIYNRASTRHGVLGGAARNLLSPLLAAVASVHPAGSHR